MRTTGILIIIALIFCPKTVNLAYSQTYTLIITVTDKNNKPVNDASVRVTTQYGPEDYRDAAWPPLRTNSSGIVIYANVYAAEPQAYIVASKFGIELASGYYTLTSETAHVTIVCQTLDDLTIFANDDEGNPLDNAQVNISWHGQDGLPWTISRSTDSNGAVTFQQISYNIYNVQVVWQGLAVHNGTINFLETEKSYTAKCNVYNLIVNVSDAADNPLSHAKVTLTRSDGWKPAAKYTQDGQASFSQLSEANYTITVSYETYMNTTQIYLENSQTTPIKIDYLPIIMHTVTIKVCWSDNQPIANADVTVQKDQNIFFKGTTDNSGVSTVQLREETYNLTVTHNGLTTSKFIDVNNDETFTVTLDIADRKSTLTVEVYNEDQTLVYGCTVEIYLNGELLENKTAVSGIVTFVLPDGTYTVIAKHQNRQTEQTVTINKDTQLPIVLKTETNPYIISILTAITVTAISVIMIIFTKKRKT
ncbi:MAG: carboxypeptidase-like regulatory domain-containing protein [Candidatus Bathyarchaeia archaeon]